jgi:phosphotransferase system HPr (HPr) family protein
MGNREVNRIVTVNNPQGLHLRPADLLARCAAKFSAEILLAKDGQFVDCRSILSIMTLGADQGAQLQITARGEDAESAAAAIVELFDLGFSELETTESN